MTYKDKLFLKIQRHAAECGTLARVKDEGPRETTAYLGGGATVAESANLKSPERSAVQAKQEADRASERLTTWTGGVARAGRWSTVRLA